MKTHSTVRFLGAAFAFMAALSNGTVGVFSRYAFNAGMRAEHLAFWRCMGALLILTLVLMLRPNGLAPLARHAPNAGKIAICSGLGIFGLYHFETQALAVAPIPIVTFVAYAGGFGVILMDVLFLKARLSKRKVFAAFLVLFGGLFLIAGDGLEMSGYDGIAYAVIAGFSYASFMFAWKFFRLSSGIDELWWFILFGAVFLAVPFLISGPALPTRDMLPSLTVLSIVPSLGGFLCTVLALRYLEAHRTQVIESSEPVFAALFAAVLFSEFLSGSGMVAAGMVVAGALLMASQAPELSPAGATEQASL